MCTELTCFVYSQLQRDVAKHLWSNKKFKNGATKESHRASSTHPKSYEFTEI